MKKGVEKGLKYGKGHENFRHNRNDMERRSRDRNVMWKQTLRDKVM